MRLLRIPAPPLRPFVKLLWASEEPAPGVGREHVLPTGRMHLVVRLSEHPLRLFAGTDDETGRTFDLAVVGGARGAFYVRDVSHPLHSVGVELHPGAADVLLGAPAGELADTHTSLGDLWGRAAAALRERLLEARDPARRLEV